VLSTERPYAAIFDALDGIYIVDRETAEPAFPQRGVGTGPFKQGPRVPGDFARFDRFDDYWAVDRKRFVDVVLRGIVEPTSIPYPRASLAYDGELANKFQKDLSRAKDLLAQAGHPRGFEATIMTSRKRNPGMVELAQILQADLRTIGVNFKIEDLEPTVYDKRFVAGEFEIAVHTFGRANKDPATLFGGAIVWYTDPKRNPSRFQSERYAKLVAEAATTLDRAKRRDIYREITLLIQDECFTIPIAEPPRVWALQRHVQDFAYSPDNTPLWHRIWLAR
jgi:peptide/nickel transport system substrate-binding protein